ncbi:ABC transporter ATP-binding protein [Virgibacillus dakarensis]|uniref:ABC transporter ATP-binding protein n=1 Tax=Virgibacillus dakarensis TaxID=1917889 RepID=UPI000B4449C8|nr:ABC transporter ATP-binding protein [Virgibacillus dakarensis]
MADIQLKDIYKSFHKKSVLEAINLEIKDKEFFIVFGPAGAGKTTLLNIIAGLHLPDRGEVILNGKSINNMEPEDRNIAMVFENYALYPHLTVFDNMASPLRSPKYKVSKEVVHQEILRVAKMLKIDMLLDRNPSELSNGQRQRVGLGRALVRNPNVFLMDEPITHLDAKLRHQMRAELKDMQKNLDTTTIYVTHDYLEALSLGDRIAVVNNGKIEQIGSPMEIYYVPRNEFVASSFGEPEINIIDAKIIKHDEDDLRVGLLDGQYSFNPLEEIKKFIAAERIENVRVGIRPKDVKVRFEKNDNNLINANVYSFEPLGAKAVMTVKVQDRLIRIIIGSDLKVQINQELFIEFNFNNAIFFDTDKKNLLSTKNEDRRIVAWQN